MELKQNNKDFKRDLTDWTQEDCQKLIENVKKAIPTLTKTAYSKSLKKIHWNDVSFDSYSPCDCRNKIRELISGTRKIRTLSSIMNDTEQNFSQIVQKMSNKTSNVNSYMLYHNEQFPQLRDKYPDLKIIQITKKISKAYRKLSIDEKKKYIDRSFELSNKSTHKTNCQNFPPKLPPRAWEIYARKKIKKILTKNPKLYKSNLKKKYLHKFWNIPFPKKFHYVLKYDAFWRSFQMQFEEHQRHNPDIDNPRASARSHKREMEIIQEYYGFPKKPPISGYALFCAQNALGATEVSKMWENVPQEEKTRLKELAGKMKLQYVDDLKRRMEEIDDVGRDLVAMYFSEPKRRNGKKPEKVNSILSYFKPTVNSTLNSGVNGNLEDEGSHNVDI